MFVYKSYNNILQFLRLFMHLTVMMMKMDKDAVRCAIHSTFYGCIGSSVIK